MINTLRAVPRTETSLGSRVLRGQHVQIGLGKGIPGPPCSRVDGALRVQGGGGHTEIWEMAHPPSAPQVGPTQQLSTAALARPSLFYGNAMFQDREKTNLLIPFALIKAH